MDQDELYLDKCLRSCKVLVGMRDKLKMRNLVVYGSLARGRLGMTSDIDLLIVSECDASEISAIRKLLQREMPEFMDSEFPYADVKVAKATSYDNPDESEYGPYMRNCREEGIVVWTREKSLT